MIANLPVNILAWIGARTLELNGRTEQWLDEYYKDKWAGTLEQTVANSTSISDSIKNQFCEHTFQYRSLNLTAPLPFPPGLATALFVEPKPTDTPPLSPLCLSPLLTSQQNQDPPHVNCCGLRFLGRVPSSQSESVQPPRTSWLPVSASVHPPGWLCCLHSR